MQDGLYFETSRHAPSHSEHLCLSHRKKYEINTTLSQQSALHRLPPYPIRPINKKRFRGLPCLLCDIPHGLCLPEPWNVGWHAPVTSAIC